MKRRVRARSSAINIRGSHVKAFPSRPLYATGLIRSEEHTSELQSRFDLVCRLLLEKKKRQTSPMTRTATRIVTARRRLFRRSPRLALGGFELSVTDSCFSETAILLRTLPYCTVTLS